LILKLMKILKVLHSIFVYCTEIVSQPLLSYRAQSEDEVTLECYVSWETYAEIFWLKQPPEGRPTCVAVATAHLLDVHYCKEFKDHPRLTAKRNSYSFNISFSSLDLSDTATYYCGALAYNRVTFGNGTKLLLEEEKQGNKLNCVFIGFENQDGYRNYCNNLSSSNVQCKDNVVFFCSHVVLLSIESSGAAHLHLFQLFSNTCHSAVEKKSSKTLESLNSQKLCGIGFTFCFQLVYSQKCHFKNFITFCF
uniref:Ig-like domain-containing protein n=1 Tax=Scleropages formosus TaxID=113540 RepID=A0A8C9S6M0_SCLFO